jgi:hypothetical protein
MTYHINMCSVYIIEYESIEEVKKIHGAKVPWIDCTNQLWTETNWVNAFIILL